MTLDAIHDLTTGRWAEFVHYGTCEVVRHHRAQLLHAVIEIKAHDGQLVEITLHGTDAMRVPWP